MSTSEIDINGQNTDSVYIFAWVFVFGIVRHSIGEHLPFRLSGLFQSNMVMTFVRGNINPTEEMKRFFRSVYVFAISFSAGVIIVLSNTVAWCDWRAL